MKESNRVWVVMCGEYPIAGPFETELEATQTLVHLATTFGELRIVSHARGAVLS